MFQSKSKKIGRWEALRFHEPQTDTLLELVPGRGACLLEVRVAGHSLLDHYQTEAELNELDWMKNALLFPFPNRLEAGRYVWEGTHYRFPINEKQTKAALHGFVASRVMQVTALDLKPDVVRIICSYREDGQDPAYPFPCVFRVQYQLSSLGGFRMDLQVQNVGPKAIPVGLGWHPYFQLGESVNDWFLQLPSCEKVMIDKRMLPTGKRKPASSFSDRKKIGEEQLDNCFALKQASGLAEALLEGPAGKLRYWQEAGPGKYPFLQLFTPPGRKSLAIEPMSCNINAFNNQEGLIRLEPGATARAAAGFHFFAANPT